MSAFRCFLILCLAGIPNVSVGKRIVMGTTLSTDAALEGNLQDQASSKEWSCPMDKCEECCYAGYYKGDRSTPDDGWSWRSEQRFLCVLKDGSKAGVESLDLPTCKIGGVEPPSTKGHCRKKGQADVGCLMQAECWLDNDMETDTDAFKKLKYCEEKVSCCCNSANQWSEQRCLPDTGDTAEAMSSKETSEIWDLSKHQSFHGTTCMFEGNTHQVYDDFKFSSLPKETENEGRLPPRTQHSKVQRGCCLKTKTVTQTLHYTYVSPGIYIGMTEMGDHEYTSEDRYKRTTDYTWTECETHEKVYSCGGDTPTPENGAEAKARLYNRVPPPGEVTLGACNEGSVATGCRCSGSPLTKGGSA